MRTNTFWIFIFTVSVGLVTPHELPDLAENVTYEGAQVWRTSLRDKDDAKLLRQLAKSHDISLWNINPERADYLIHDDQRTKVYHKLRDHSLNHTVIIMNVQHRIEATMAKETGWTDDSLRIGHRLDWKSYPSIKIINEYYNFLKENFPSLVKIRNIGKSVANRPIKMIIISNGNPTNKAIVVSAGVHAREWIAITSALFVAHKIITKFDQQPAHVQNKDWYIIPVMNPDGYEFTHTRDRLWRKNRRWMVNSACVGIDINRNYEKDWDVDGLSVRDQCQEDFSGPHPFSEPETVAMKDLLQSLKITKRASASAYVDLHSYGQFILYPWSANFKKPQNIKSMKSIAEGMKDEMYKIGGRRYKTGTAGSLLYFASGVGLDWVHDFGVPISLAIEARDTGLHGFLLPPDEITVQGDEIFCALRYLAKSINSGILMRSSTAGENVAWF